MSEQRDLLTGHSPTDTGYAATGTYPLGPLLPLARINALERIFQSDIMPQLEQFKTIPGDVATNECNRLHYEVCINFLGQLYAVRLMGDRTAELRRTEVANVVSKQLSLLDKLALSNPSKPKADEAFQTTLRPVQSEEAHISGPVPLEEPKRAIEKADQNSALDSDSFRPEADHLNAASSSQRRASSPPPSDQDAKETQERHTMPAVTASGAQGSLQGSNSTDGHANENHAQFRSIGEMGNKVFSLLDRIEPDSLNFPGPCTPDFIKVNLAANIQLLQKDDPQEAPHVRMLRKFVLVEIFTRLKILNMEDLWGDFPRPLK